MSGGSDVCDACDDDNVASRDEEEEEEEEKGERLTANGECMCVSLRCVRVSSLWRMR